jgi:hypothetical protein
VGGFPVRKPNEKFQTEVGFGVKYSLHSTPRPPVPGYGEVITRTVLPDQDGVITVYSSGYVVIETGHFSLEFNVNTGSMRTL